MLRQLATTSEFSNAEREIKSQIILTCSSSQLRRRALRDSSFTLKQLLDLARAFETSEMQAAGIEKNTQVSDIERVATIPQTNFKRKMTSKSPQQKTVQRKQQSTCRKCGGSFPHPGGQSACPARGLSCKSCGKPNHFCTLLFQQGWNKTTENTQNHDKNLI